MISHGSYSFNVLYVYGLHLLNGSMNWRDTNYFTMEEFWQLLLLQV